MIVGARPRLRQIILEVWRPLTVLFVWDVAVTVFHFQTSFREPPLPIALFGTALALFLGFRTNAAYARWWEARSLWGALINTSRSLSRLTVSFLPPAADRDNLVLTQIAFAQALRCQLRRQDPMPEISRIVGDELSKQIERRSNRANGLLQSISRMIAQARSSGSLDQIQQMQMERLLTDAANAQGGMERIKNTPLPNGFRFLPNLFTRLFCILLPVTLVEALGIFTPLGSTLIGLVFLAALRVGEDLMDPFANEVHDVPLTAMCTTIEIDLMETIDREGPAPLAPDKGVLW